MITLLMNKEGDRMNRIKEARKLKKLSQKELATMLGVTPQAISLYEKGKRKISDDFYHQLATVLDTDIDYLKGNTFNKDELVTMLNNSYLNNKYSMLRQYIIYYLDFINVKKPDELFTVQQLEALTDSVKKYWLTYFDFFLDANYKKLDNYKKLSDSNFNSGSKTNPNEIIITPLKLLPDYLVPEFISKIFAEIRRNDKTQAQIHYQKNVKPVIMRFIDTADLVTAYGSKKQIIEFNNRLVETINNFSKTLEKIPENPNSGSKKIDKYIKRLK